MEKSFEEKLNAILSNPEQMAGIAQMAQQLLGQNGGEAAPAETPAPPASEAGGIASVLGKLAGGGKSKSEALLLAMEPYLRPERREKLRRAMKLSRMLSLAGSVMKEGGGGLFGL